MWKIFVMERILIEELLKWKEKSDRKPLILRGARQVGKTWLLKDFGKRCFENVCYVNFEQKDVLGAIFLLCRVVVGCGVA